MDLASFILFFLFFKEQIDLTKWQNEFSESSMDLAPVTQNRVIGSVLATDERKI